MSTREGGVDRHHVDTSQYLYFSLRDHNSGDRDEGYALPMEAIREIIRVPDLNTIPLSGHHLLGVTNLRGSVLPIVSLPRLLHRTQGETQSATRILVLKGEAPIGLWVDSVDEVDQVTAERVESAETMQSSADFNLLNGFIRPHRDGSGPLRRLLHAPSLIAASQCRSLQADSQPQGALRSRKREDNGATLDTRQFVCFDLGGQDYALPIQQVKEVVRLPERVESLSSEPEHILGILPLRDLMVPLIDLAILYHIPTDTDRHNRRVIVVPVGARDGREFIGVVVNHIRRVSELTVNAVQAVPDMLGHQPGFQDIAGIIRADDNHDRLTAVLDGHKLIAQHQLTDIARVADTETTMTNSAAEIDDTHIDDRQIVVFTLDDEEYGVRIEAAKEILRVPESLTHVPKADTAIEGVINLRGMVLPVIDLRKRFGLAVVERHHRQRIIVLNLDGRRTGFIVDAVREVLKVSDSDIEASPPLSDRQNRVISEMASLTDDKRLILLIDVSRLLDQWQAIPKEPDSLH